MSTRFILAAAVGVVVGAYTDAGTGFKAFALVPGFGRGISPPQATRSNRHTRRRQERKQGQ